MGWQKIKNDYIAGEATLKELAAKYDVSFSTIQKKSMEEGWNKLRKKKRRRTEEKIVELTAERCARDIEHFYRIGNELLVNAENLIKNIQTADDLVKCSNAMSRIKDVLDLKSNEDRDEQRARIEKLRKDAQTESQGDTTVTVRFEEDISKWCK